MRSMLAATIGYSLLFGAAVVAASLAQPPSRTTDGDLLEPLSMSRDVTSGVRAPATLRDVRTLRSATMSDG